MTPSPPSSSPGISAFKIGLGGCLGIVAAVALLIVAAFGGCAGMCMLGGNRRLSSDPFYPSPSASPPIAKAPAPKLLTGRLECFDSAAKIVQTCRFSNSADLDELKSLRGLANTADQDLLAFLDDAIRYVEQKDRAAAGRLELALHRGLPPIQKDARATVELMLTRSKIVTMDRLLSLQWVDGPATFEEFQATHGAPRYGWRVKCIASPDVFEYFLHRDAIVGLRAKIGPSGRTMSEVISDSAPTSPTPKNPIGLLARLDDVAETSNDKK